MVINQAVHAKTRRVDQGIRSKRCGDRYLDTTCTSTDRSCTRWRPSDLDPFQHDNPVATIQTHRIENTRMCEIHGSRACLLGRLRPTASSWHQPQPSAATHSVQFCALKHGSSSASFRITTAVRRGGCVDVACVLVRDDGNTTATSVTHTMTSSTTVRRDDDTAAIDNLCREMQQGRARCHGTTLYNVYCTVHPIQ